MCMCVYTINANDKWHLANVARHQLQIQKEHMSILPQHTMQ